MEFSDPLQGLGKPVEVLGNRAHVLESIVLVLRKASFVSNSPPQIETQPPDVFKNLPDEVEESVSGSIILGKGIAKPLEGLIHPMPSASIADQPSGGDRIGFERFA